MELLMIYKISPDPSFPKRGREKADMTHSIWKRLLLKLSEENLPGGSKFPIHIFFF
jgi:hypothetical protein